MGTAALARAQRARGASNENQDAQKEIEKEIQRLVDLANKEDLFDEMFKVPKSEAKEKVLKTLRTRFLI